MKGIWNLKKGFQIDAMTHESIKPRIEWCQPIRMQVESINLETSLGQPFER